MQDEQRASGYNVDGYCTTGVAAGNIARGQHFGADRLSSALAEAVALQQALLWLIVSKPAEAFLHFDSTIIGWAVAGL